MPLDLRGQGVFSTLAYFAGVDVKGGLGGGRVTGRAEEGQRRGKMEGEGRGIKMEARVEEGEKIAEAGREWAGKVLRKEDMEVYMFRLLLEWARLTDDRRDELGFGM